MDPVWFPPEDRSFRAPVNSWGTVGCICVLSLLIPPGKIRIAITLPALAYIASDYRTYSSGNPGEDYLTSINIVMSIVKWVDFVLLKTPERQMYRIDLSREGKPPKDKNVRQMTMWQKFKWSSSLWVTYRGIGWNWQVKNCDSVPTAMTRRTFLIQSMIGYAKSYLMLDVLEHFLFATQYSRSANRPDILGAPIFHQILLGWCVSLRSGIAMALAYHLCAAVAVSLYISTPQDWPSSFGTFTKGYTLRKIWGYCWHQYLRQIFSSVTSGINRILGIRKGSLSSRYIQLYGAFATSAVIHHMGSLNVPYSPAIKHQLFFFLSQPLAITLEDTVIYLGKRYGIRESIATRTIGFAWVFCWLSYSLRYFAAMAFAMAGPDMKHPLIWSIADRILGRRLW